MIRNQICNSAAFLQVLVRPTRQANAAAMNLALMRDIAAYRVDGLLDPVEPGELGDSAQLGELSKLIWGTAPRSGRSAS